MHVDVPTLDELIRIQRDSICLDARLTYAASGSPLFAALVVGAHPLLGGHADNNVVNALRSGLAANSAIAMSFNYRGVGGSEPTDMDWPRMISEFWKSASVPEERLWIEDGHIAVRRLRELTEAPIVLVGYSFGCRVVSDLANSETTLATICVSPNPTQNDLSGLETRTGPLLVISSDNDFSCPLETIATWFSQLSGPKHNLLIPNAEHFFRCREGEVVDGCLEFLREVTKERASE